MNKADLQIKLDELLALPAETEWLEFKHNNKDSERIGQYISAISNSAVLCGKQAGFICWGIEDETHRPVGTNFAPGRTKIGNIPLENWLHQGLEPHIGFKIHELTNEHGRFVIIEVPPAAHVPTAFKGKRYIRIGSVRRDLKDAPEKERELWKIFDPGFNVDWSGGIVDNALIDDLDGDAIAFARQQYAVKNPNHSEDALKHWDVTTFLNKAKLCIGGKMTRTALLLLGKPESIHFLKPTVAQVTWVLKDGDGIEQDYTHLEPPLLMVSDAVLSRVRNLTIRQLPSGTLFPHEVTQYDPWVLRETLHNCIAHHDYETGARISIVEMPEALLFSNRGAFIPGTVEEMIQRDAPPDVYRNSFLAQAMVNLNMIDTIGSGIRKMFMTQRNRNFPMPDFDLSEVDRVKVRLDGKILDENYTRMLMENADLALMDALSLDKVQRKRELAEEEFKRLKKAGLIEGRRPNLFVSARVAQATDDRATYIMNRGLDKEHYKGLILSYLEKFGASNRKALDDSFLERMPEILSPQQKRNRLKNLLQELRREKRVMSVGSGPAATWELAKPRAVIEDLEQD